MTCHPRWPSLLILIQSWYLDFLHVCDQEINDRSCDCAMHSVVVLTSYVVWFNNSHFLYAVDSDHTEILRKPLKILSPHPILLFYMEIWTSNKNLWVHGILTFSCWHCRLYFMFDKNLERALRILDQGGVQRIISHPGRRSVFQVPAPTP